MAKIKSVRIKETKHGTFALQFTNPEGRLRRISAGPDEQHAQRLAVKFNDWLFEGKDPERELEFFKIAERQKQITFREFFPEFMKRHGSNQSKKMQDSYDNSFKNICRCPDISGTQIGLIKRSQVIDYMTLRMNNDGVTSATVNREAAFLKGMLSRAVEWDILDDNPLRGLRMFREAEKREVKITVEQAASLITKLPSPMDNIVEFAIYSGFRKENILSLRIESIRFYDIKPDSNYIPEGEVELIIKGNRKVKFPLGSKAVEVLQRMIGDRTEGYVFINPHTGTRYKSIHKTFDRAVRRLGLTVNGTKLRFHDLRHVFATWLHSGGVSLDSLRTLLGHKDRLTTDRYVSQDRIAIGKELRVLPNIREAGQRKMSQTG